jgi:hypothetical protein
MTWVMTMSSNFLATVSPATSIRIMMSNRSGIPFSWRRAAACSGVVRFSRSSVKLTIAASLGWLTACGALDVNDPTTIQGSSLDNTVGANYLWTTARLSFGTAAGQAAYTTGMVTDEFFVDADPLCTGCDMLALDQRDRSRYENITKGGRRIRSGKSSFATQQLHSPGFARTVLRGRETRRSASSLPSARSPCYALPKICVLDSHCGKFLILLQSMVHP